MKPTKPRVTTDDVESHIASEHYFTALEGVVGGQMVDGQQIGDIAERETLGLLTLCVLVLRNGFTVTGESACPDAEHFDAKVGRKVARQKAVGKVWTLMGYALKERQSCGA